MLFDNLPPQPTPRVLVMGDHALILCSVCDGTGEGDLIWPEGVRRCSACKGAGHVLRRIVSAKPD
jgi:DnaJ-class molecular chaperone